MARVAKRTVLFLLVSQSLIEPMKCQLAGPGMFFALQSGELLSLSKDEVNIWQGFFECGMDTECSDVVTYTIDANSEKSEEGKVQEENSSGGKGASWKKMPEMALISRGKDTKQSTTHMDNNSSRAVYGNSNNNWMKGSCTHTENHFPLPAWWRVDLGQRAMIYNVMITNRGDCCAERLRDFSIRIGFEDKNGANPFCREHAGITTSITADFKCNKALPGQFIYIESALPHVPLTLCEVAVYGKYF